jgi:[ribosomal protein S18]-alanine N-acetyltransferase
MSVRPIDLRPGAPRDIGTVEAIMADAFDPRFGEAWTRGQCLGVLAMPGVRLVLAERDGTPAGFAMTRTIGDEAELLLLAVAPGHRRRGVAAALLRTVVEDCASFGVTTLHLEVRSGNDAVKLYARHGFAKVGERRGYYRGKTGQLFDAHTYRRAIG